MSILDRIDRKLNNMNGMLVRIGLDPDILKHQQHRRMFRTAMHACLSCPNVDICTQWQVHAPSEIDRVPEFCPNGRRFENAKAVTGNGRQPG